MKQEELRKRGIGFMCDFYPKKGVEVTVKELKRRGLIPSSGFLGNKFLRCHVFGDGETGGCNCLSEEEDLNSEPFAHCLPCRRFERIISFFLFFFVLLLFALNSNLSGFLLFLV